MNKYLVLNNPKQKRFRQILRNNMPEPEKRLWKVLRNKNLLNLKFRRQYGIDRYVLDFYCPEKHLAIEVDGETHYDDINIRKYDRNRDKFLKENGINVLRFTNIEILENIDGVVEKIIEELKE